MNKRGCNNCGAFFQGEDEVILSKLYSHLNECTKEKPFKNDTNANGYEGV